jgi:hypothetical protein
MFKFFFKHKSKNYNKIDYSSERNAKKLKVEFIKRHPKEASLIIKKIKEADKFYKDNKIIKTYYLDIILDVPPTYEPEIITLTKKDTNKFINTNFDINIRKYLISFMELYIIDKSPKLIVELN